MGRATTVCAPSATAAAIALLVSLAACAKGPTAPSGGGSTLNLREGPQIIAFLGFSVSSDPQFPACTPLGVPRAGTYISTQATLSRSGSEWVLRSPSATGTLEMRLQGEGRSSVEGELIAGTARGRATDSGQGLRPPIDVTVDLSAGGGTATLSGVVSRTAFLVQGRAAGTISFSDSQQATGHCSAIQWMMQPASGIFSQATLLIPPG